MIFASLAITMPHQLKYSAPKPLPSGPRVSTTIDSVEAVPPTKAYEGIIREAAALYRVDASLIRSVMHAESAFDPSAVSRAGAMGLMQLMPDIAEAFGVVHPFDPRENIMAGTRLLRELLDQHRGNLRLTIASYNAGPSRIGRLRKQAAETGLNPNVWFDNVEIVAAKEIGQETVTYVRNIYKYYVAYKLALQQAQHREKAKAAPG